VDSFLIAASVLLPLAYLLSVLAYGLVYLHRHEGAQRACGPLLLGTLALHLASLLAAALQWHQLPVATVPQALTFVAFAVAVVYALLERLIQERSTGVWMLTLVFCLQLLSSILGRPQPPDLDLFQSPLFSLHITSALLGYAAFVVAGAYGFLFLALYRELKSARFRFFYGRLPPLEVLDRMTSGGLRVGFTALTVAVVTGFVWALEIDYQGWWRDTKILFTFATWALYAGALLMRRMRRWQGRQTALVSLAGLTAILVSLMISSILGRGFHSL